MKDNRSTGSGLLPEPEPKLNGLKLDTSPETLPSAAVPVTVSPTASHAPEPEFKVASQ